MSRTTQIIGFSVPATLVQQLEALAKEECRTKSELFREMFRVYTRYRRIRDRDEERWILNVIEEGKREQSGKAMSRDEMLKESERLSTYGEQQAKRRGLKAGMNSVSRIIHERRRARKP